MEPVTVSQAIEKGRLQLRYIPVIVTVSGVTAILSGASTMYNTHTWIGFGQFAAGVIAILLSTIYYLVRLPQWLIWAYSNVRNVHELKQLATLDDIIPNSDSWKWKYMIVTDYQRQQLEDLEQNFLMPDVYIYDYLDEETVYYYRALIVSPWALVAFLSSSLGICLAWKNMLWLAVPIWLISLLFVIATSKGSGERFPALTISNKGISSPKQGLDSWADISNMHYVNKLKDDSVYCWLCYETPSSTREILLTSIRGANPETIIHTLNVYRARYEASEQTN